MGGGGPQILSCKDSELIAEIVFSPVRSDGDPAVKIEGEGVSRAIFTL